MPLIRVTPETAAATVEALVQEFRETVVSAGRSPAIERIQRSADELARIASARVVEVEARVVGEVPKPLTGVAAGFLQIPPSLLEARGREETGVPEPHGGRVRVVRIRFGTAAPARLAGQRLSPVLVIVRGTTEPPDEALMKDLVSDIQSRPLTLVLAPPGSDWARALQGLGSRNAFACRIRDLDEALAGRTLEQELTVPPWSNATALASSWSVTRTLASLHEAFAVALESEQRALGAKRALVDQQMSRQASQSNPTEVIGEVRSTLQKRFDRFQKSFSAELDELLDPHEGSLAVEVETTIRSLSGFEVEKKPKIDVFTVPDEVEKGLLERAETALKALLRDEIRRLDEAMREAEAGVERRLESAGGPPLTVNFQRLDRKYLQTFVDRSVTLQRPYRGEVSRRGPMDFFMAARRYQMIFFMVASAFGLSFIRSFKEVTIPIGIVLLAYGLLSVVNSARRQRAETEEKELGKAREALRADFKRAFMDVRRAWEQAIGNHLSEQQSAALEKVDSGMKAHAARTAQAAAQERELLQEQLKNLDNSKRKIADGIKKSESAREDLGQLVGQLQGFYAAAVPPIQPVAHVSSGGGGADPEAPRPKAGGELPTAARVALETLQKGEATNEAAETLARLQKGGATRMFQTLREKRMEGKGSPGSGSRQGSSSPRQSSPRTSSSSSRAPDRPSSSSSAEPSSPSTGGGEQESPAERLKRLKESLPASQAKRPSPTTPAAAGSVERSPGAPKNDIAAEAAKEAERLQAKAAEQLAKLRGGAPVETPATPSKPEEENGPARGEQREPEKRPPGRLEELKGKGGLTQAFATLKKRKRGGAASGDETSSDESSSGGSES